jgi:hypothetical protein
MLDGLPKGMLLSERPREEAVMKRLVKAILGAIALTLTLSLPAQASVKWVCNVPGEGDVTFVTAADAALHGITTANAKAGQVFHDLFGEVCRVVVDP